MEKVYDSKYCEIWMKGDICLVKAVMNYIPIVDFQEVFNTVDTLADSLPIHKLIFDKSKLSVFHQPSMEWYFVEWKEKMFTKGLTIHRKILPKDPVFRECVKLGREKIKKSFPHAKFHEMDIQYSNSIEAAITELESVS